MDLRDNIGSIKKKNIEDWKKSFEDQVLYNKNISASTWAKDKLGKIDITRSDSWDTLKVVRDNYSHALLQSYFMELLFNTLKYRDYSDDIWNSIVLNENQNYLIISLTNKIELKDAESVGMGKGLRGLKNDLEMLNGKSKGKKEKPYLSAGRKNNEYQVTLLLKKELFIMSQLDDIKVPWEN